MEYKKSLVIYFSRADENWYDNGLKVLEKGNTEKVAEYVRDLIGADLFKVEPTVPYSKSYEECKRESQERIGNAPIKEHLNDISDYEVVYIMTPVYYDSYAPEIETAIKDLDFSDICIRVLTTHEGSGLGHVVNDVMKACNHNVYDALSIVGSEVEQSKEKIKKWVNEL